MMMRLRMNSSLLGSRIWSRLNGSTMRAASTLRVPPVNPADLISKSTDRFKLIGNTQSRYIHSDSFMVARPSVDRDTSVPLSAEEESVYQQLVVWCGDSTKKYNNNKQKGVLLGSRNALLAIDALDNPTTSLVEDVPVDLREQCRLQLLRSLTRPGGLRAFLLCNAGYKGSGKTILQAFNMRWFAEETKGISVEVTFNMDQSVLWNKDATDDRKFEAALAVRIFHRVIEYFNGAKVAQSKVSEDSPLVQSVVSMGDPLTSCLVILRKLLGADKDTKILLCVDELKKALNYGSTSAEHNRLLKSLGAALDRDPSLFLSVSVYGFLDLSLFSTGSNRGLLLQSLPPIFLTVPDLQLSLLPPVLQQFMDEKKRVNVAFNDEDLVVYARLSRLLVDAAGHPRRVNYVLHELSTFRDSLHPLPVDFSAKLSLFLDIHEPIIRDDWNGDAGFPTNWKALARSDVLSAAVESLARDCACKFLFPDCEATTENRLVMLKGTKTGYCSFLPCEGDMIGHAFVPMPVMRLFKSHFSMSKSGPCTQAMMMLAKGLDKFGDVSLATKTTKDLEEVMTAAVLLYSRSNDAFSLSSLCDPKQCDKRGLDRVVHGGPGVALWKGVGVESVHRSSPHHDIDLKREEFKSQLTNYVTQLQNDPSCPGAVFHLTDENNMGGGFYGLFKCFSEDSSEYVLMVGSCKDWFKKDKDRPLNSYVDEVWRDSQGEFPGPNPVVVRVNGKDISVHVRFLLFSTDDLLNKDTPCGRNTGVVTVQGMRRWCPSAAYACETAHHMRKIFSAVETE